MQVGAPTAAAKQADRPALHQNRSMGQPLQDWLSKDSCCTADFVAQRQVLQLGSTVPADYSAGAESTMNFRVSTLADVYNRCGLHSWPRGHCASANACKLDDCRVHATGMESAA